MNKFQEMAIARLYRICEDVGKLRPQLDWSFRTARAVESIANEAKAGRVSDEALLDFLGFTFQMLEAIHPQSIGREKASKAGKERHRGNQILKAKAVKDYCEPEKNWSSKRHAAKVIFPKVQGYAKEHRLKPLSEDNGETAVYRWLLKIDH